MWMRDNWALGWRYFSVPEVIPIFDSEGHLKKKIWATCCRSPVLVFLVQKQHMNGVVSEEAFFSFCASNLFLNPPIQAVPPGQARCWSLVCPLSRWSTHSEGAFDLQMNSQNAFEFRMSSAVSKWAFQAKNSRIARLVYAQQGVSQRKRGAGFGFWTCPDFVEFLSMPPTYACSVISTLSWHIKMEPGNSRRTQTERTRPPNSPF